MESNKSIKEEIDLIYLLRATRDGISNFINWIISFSIKNSLLLIVFMAIGGGIGFGVFNVKKEVYVSDLSIAHNRFDNDQCFELINNLSKLNGKEELVAKALGINKEMAAEIKSLSYEPINPRVSKIYNDSVEVRYPFKVIAEVYSQKVLDTLEKRIMSYLETNAYGVKRKELEKDYLTKYEEKLKNEIQAIDTLKRLVNQSIAHKNLGNGVIIDEPIDPVKISQRAVELYNAQLKTQEKQQLNDSFELIVGFNGGVRKTANVLMSSIYGALGGYLIGLIILYRRSKMRA